MNTHAPKVSILEAQQLSKAMQTVPNSSRSVLKISSPVQYLLPKAQQLSKAMQTVQNSSRSAHEISSPVQTCAPQASQSHCYFPKSSSSARWCKQFKIAADPCSKSPAQSRSLPTPFLIPKIQQLAQQGRGANDLGGRSVLEISSPVQYVLRTP